MTIPPTPSTVCWKPIAAPLRRGARGFRGCRERQAVPAHAEDARDDEHGHEDGDRAVDEQRRPPRVRPRARRASLMKSGTRRRSRSDQPPDHDPRGDAADLHRCEHERGVRGREAARVVQEQHDEAHDRELAREHERACRAENPHPKVAQRTDELLGDVLVDVPLAQHDAGEHRPDHAFTASATNAACTPPARDDRRQGQGAGETADRDRRLPDPEREPALVRPRTSASPHARSRS